jgi:predicted RNA-binding Zn-ribbon protein involved in translation (DUF1610 family)
MNALKTIMVVCFWLIFGRLFGLLGILVITVIGILVVLISSGIKKLFENLESDQQNNLPSKSIGNNNPNIVTFKCPKCDSQVSVEHNNIRKITKCSSCGLIFQPSNLINNFVDLDKM